MFFSMFSFVDWIFDLGPIVGGQYQYSLITDASDLQLFVLARDPEEFLKLYDSEVTKLLASVGFSGRYKEPIAIAHPQNCQYLPEI